MRPEDGCSEQVIADQVIELGRRLSALREVRIAGLDLTLPQAMLLRSLVAPLPMNQVASRLRCDASNVTGIVDRLEARELVERRPGNADRRVKEIVLTEAGRRLQERVEAALANLPGLDHLSQEELEALGHLLRRALSAPGWASASGRRVEALDRAQADPTG